MPRFFFDLRLEGDCLEQDDVGVDLPDFETVYLEAHRAAVDIWAEARREGRRIGKCSFEVRDVHNEVVLELPFSEASGVKDISAPRPRLPNLLLRQLEIEVSAAERELRDAGRHADQRARVERLEQKGYDTTLAKSLLATFLQTQALRERHRDQPRRYSS
jgi:hypothetical protein